MRHKNPWIVLVIITLLSNTTIGQSLDSLKNLLFQSTQQAEKALLYNEITWLSHEQQQDSSLYFAQQACAFAQQNELLQPLITAELQLAEILRTQRDFETSAKHIAKAKDLMESGSFDKEQVRLLFIEGSLAYSQYEDDKAMRLFKAGYQLSQQQDGEFCSDFCIKLAFLNSDLTQYTIAENYLQDGLNCTKDPIQKIKLHTQLGNLYAKQQQYSKALEIYQKNSSLATAIHSDLESSKAYLNIGNIHLIEGQWVIALEFYLKSAVLKEKIKDQEGLAELHQNIAVVYKNQNRYDKSIEYYTKCQDYYTTTKDSTSLAEIWTNIGLINILQNEHQTAIQILNKALSYFKENPNPSISLIAQLNLGFAYTQLSNYEQAINLLTVAAENANQQQDRYSLASIHNLFGANYFYLKDYPKSLEHYQDALSISQELGIIDQQQSALFGLYESNEYLGNSSIALNWYKQYVTIKDSLYNTATTNRLAELQEQYDTKQKEQAIQQLNIENKNIALENKLKTKQLNQFFLIIVFGIIVICLLVILWWYRNKQQKERIKHHQILHDKKVNQLINQQEIEMLDAVIDAQQKERKGIAKEIHDTLGSFLATLKYQHEAGKELIGAQNNQKQYQRMETLIAQTATEVRNIAHQMATGEKFDFDLQTAINQLIERIRYTQQFDLHFNYFGYSFSLSRDLELTIYRVVQELLSNILKHAQASEAMLQINQSENEIILMVEDNGKGFNNTATKGLGLKSISERVEKFNGQLIVDSHPQRGTTISLTIPLS